MTRHAEIAACRRRCGAETVRSDDEIEGNEPSVELEFDPALPGLS